MAREINSHGVKYVGIYIRELPWKLTADVAARVVWKRSKTRTRRNTAGVSSIRSERDFSQDIRFYRYTNLCAWGAQMAVTFLDQSIDIVNFWRWVRHEKNPREGKCKQNSLKTFCKEIILGLLYKSHGQHEERLSFCKPSLAFLRADLNLREQWEKRLRDATSYIIDRVSIRTRDAATVKPAKRSRSAHICLGEWTMDWRSYWDLTLTETLFISKFEIVSRGEIFRTFRSTIFPDVCTNPSHNFCYSTNLTHGGCNTYFIDTHDRRCANFYPRWPHTRGRQRRTDSGGKWRRPGVRDAGTYERDGTRTTHTTIIENYSRITQSFD